MKQFTALTFLAGTAAAVTTTLPASAGETAEPTAIPVSGDFDGGMMRFERERELPSSQMCFLGEGSFYPG